MLKEVKLVSLVAPLLLLSLPAAAQVAPTGSHYAARASDTGHEGPNESGGYSTSLPLDLPSARGGLPVPVAVVSGKRGFGAAGLGWDVPLSFVHVDKSFGHRRPAVTTTGSVLARERITVTLPGRPPAEMLQLASTTSPKKWVSRHAADLTMVADGEEWNVFDGDGITYTFHQDDRLGATGGPSDGGLWLLTSITGPGGSSVRLSYAIANVTLPNSPQPALAIDLTDVSYNPHPSSGCFKNEVTLLYAIPLNAVPQSFSVIGDRILTRDHRLAAIDVRSRATCGALPERLRRYVFAYAEDPDTRQERLASVKLLGRHGTSEENVALPVASYTYGSAADPTGSTPVLRYRKTHRIEIPAVPGPLLGSRIAGMWKLAASDFQPPLSSVPNAFASKQTLSDFTGDGRPDFIYPDANNGKLRILRNLPGASGTSMFVPPTASAELNDATFTRRLLDASSAAYDRYHGPPPEAPNYDYVWTQTIDVNGDGRLDVIDAAEKPYHWVIYLNTPDVGPSGIKWMRRAYDVSTLYNEFVALHLDVKSGYLPLSRRYTTRDYDIPMCWKLNASTGVYEAFPSGLGWLSACAAYPSTYPTKLPGDEHTYVEWEVKDINGDGYPDVVFNSSPVGVVSKGPDVPDPVFPGTTCGDGAAPPCYMTTLEEHRVRPADAGNDVRAVLNVLGVYISDDVNGSATYPFTKSEVLLSGTPCGVGHWTTRKDEYGEFTPQAYSHTSMACSIDDVNGDGLVDRIIDRSALLGTGFGFGTIRMELPAAPDLQISSHQELCEEQGKDAYVARQITALRDLTGDGIPDFIVRDWPKTTYRVFVGTGAGFAAPISIVPDGPLDAEAGFEISRSDESCYGFGSATNGGLFDIDGDGKPERLTLVKTGANTWAIDVWQLTGGSGPGVPEAGRIVQLDNGYGALTSIDYRSAKEDGSTNHQVPYPEIVVSEVKTAVRRIDGTGVDLALAPTQYAYGDIGLIYDSAADVFRSSGYRRRVQLTYGDSQPERQSRATIYDHYTLDPFPTTFPFPNATQRMARSLLPGRVKDVTVLSGGIDGDAWSLLAVDIATDPRAIGGIRYSVDTARDARYFNDTVAAVGCIDMVYPYDYEASSSHQTPFVNPCSTRGFSYTSSTISWRGSAAPPSANNVQTATNVRGVDDYGRVTRVHHANDLARLDDDVCIDTEYAVPTSLDKPVLSAIASTKVWGGPGCSAGDRASIVYAEESFEYDKLYPGLVSQGLKTAHTQYCHEPDTGAHCGTIRDYDIDYNAAATPTKMRKVREDGATRDTSVDYDEFGLVPVRVTTAASGVAPLTSVYAIDPISLTIESTTDPNGTKRGVSFDGFGRESASTVQEPGGNTVVLASTRYHGFEGGDPLGRRVITTEYTDASGIEGRSSVVYLDALGRTRRGEVELGQDHANEKLVVGVRTYDLFGRVIFAADPYPSTQDASTAYGTTVHYDRFGAPLVEVRGRGFQPYTTVPDSSQERFPTVFWHSFANHAEIIAAQGPDALTAGTPQYGVRRETVTSAIGRVLTRSTWQSATRVEHAQFAYDRLGHQTQMYRYQNPSALTGAVAWSFRFNSLGQVISLLEPPAALQQRSYSDWGELKEVQWTPAAPEPLHTIISAHDALGRLTETHEEHGGVRDDETVRLYRYDVPGQSPLVDPTYVSGRLAWAWAPSGEVVLSYDALGRVNARSFTDSAQNVYVERQGFNVDGSQAWIELNLPDNNYARERVEYGYDTAGKLRWMWSSDGANTEELFNAVELDPSGRLLRASFGSGTEYAASYATVGRRLLKEVHLSRPGGDGRHVYFNSYDNAGRELERYENYGAAESSSTASYDPLGRLRKTVGRRRGNTVDWLFNYDPLGNVTTLSDQAGTADATLSYQTSDRDRICRIGYGNGGLGGTTCNVSYDSFGNIVQQPTRTDVNMFEYFVSGDVRGIRSASGARVTFRYDPFGQLQELELEDQATSNYRSDRHFGSFISRRLHKTALASTQYVARQFPGPGLVVSRRGPNARWVYQFDDSHGTRFTTDQEGNFIQDVDYTSYGEAFSSGASPGSPEFSTDQWNGGDALEPFGVVRLGARLYDPVTGRFLSRDPALTPRTSATSNPYAFAFNDPINFSDPSGFDPDPCFGMCSIWASLFGGNEDTSRAAALGAAAAYWMWTYGIDMPGGVSIDSGEALMAYGKAYDMKMQDWATTSQIRQFFPQTATSRFFESAADTVYDMGADAVWMATHPGQTLDAVDYAISHPLATAELIIDGVVSDAEGVFSGDAEAAGKGAVGIVSTVGPGNIVKLLSKAKLALGVTSLIGRGSKLGKYEVGIHKELVKFAADGLDSHHVGQKAIMKDLVRGYDLATAPAILVPEVGHRFNKPGVGVVSRSTEGFESGRAVIARDIRELRRVYPDIPTSQLQKLIDLNKLTYPELRSWK
jgi:RHS repeat-associated protein